MPDVIDRTATGTGRTQVREQSHLVSGYMPVGNATTNRFHEIYEIAERGTGTGSSGARSSLESETAKAIRLLHERSGLTWDELSKLFGASRRALHHWANGARLNQRHVQLLEKLVRIISRVDCGDKNLTRAVLLAPSSSGGVSIYQELLKATRSRSTVKPEGFAVDELFELVSNTREKLS